MGKMERVQQQVGICKFARNKEARIVREEF
jgi:hypothetical protein